MKNLEIIYHDDHLIAINKPHGLLVHRSPIASDATEFAVQLLRNQVDRHVFPVHRLDRKTSGVLLFAFDGAVAAAIQALFKQNQVEKTYLAIVRGFTDDTGTIEYPLKKESGTMQEAVTHFRTLARGELKFPSHRHSTSRYSLVEARPATGRMHQIRRHFAHIFHPIIGDRPHGCNKQNRFFKTTFHMDTMLLHARSITFKHPVTDENMDIRTIPGDEFMSMLKLIFGLTEIPGNASDRFSENNHQAISNL